MAQVAPTLEDALAIANRAVTKEDLITITGSFYLVGEAKRLFENKAIIMSGPGSLMSRSGTMAISASVR
jgi:hypothetical protein